MYVCGALDDCSLLLSFCRNNKVVQYNRNNSYYSYYILSLLVIAIDRRSSSSLDIGLVCPGVSWVSV